MLTYFGIVLLNIKLFISNIQNLDDHGLYK